MKIRNISVSIFTFLGILLGVLFLTPILTEAEEPGIGFSVAPILPASQIDKNLGYYYLETTVDEEQTFEVKLSSQKKEKQTVKMFVQDAYTGTNGNLTYGVDGIDGFKQDKTLKDPISQIVKPVSEMVELNAGEEKTVSFKISPPKESYNGAKVGRLVFKSETEGNDGNNAVIEDYQYGISIILSENGDDYNDGDIKSIALNDVKATVKYGKRLVTANLQNPNPKRILNLDLQATVTKKGSDKIIKQTKISEFQFAPNSNVDLEVDWGLSELKSGEYSLNIIAKNEYDDIHLSKDFRITSDLAKKLNTDSAFKIKTPIWIKVISISSGVLTGGLSVVIINRNKKWLKISHRKRNKKKNKIRN